MLLVDQQRIVPVSTGHSLLQKTLMPLVALSLLLCTIVFWAVSAAQQDVLVHELRTRVQVAVAALEHDLAYAEHSAMALERSRVTAEKALGLKRWFVVDLARQQVVESSQPVAGDRHVSAIKDLTPLVTSQSSWRTGAEGTVFVYSEPFKGSGWILQVEGDRALHFVGFVDGEPEILLRREKMLRLLLASLAIMGVLIAGVAMTLRRRVITPLKSIQHALASSQPGTSTLVIRGLSVDEIGDLGGSLQSAFERLSKSERFVGSILQSLSGCAYSVDARNGEVLQFTGNMDKRGDGRSLWNPLELDAEQRVELGDAVACGMSWDLEYAVQTADGQTRWVNNRGRLIQNRYGEGVSYDGLVLDVTDHRLRGEQVRLFSEALRKSSNEVYVVDMESQTLQYANAAALRNVGYTAEEFFGLPNATIAREMLNPEVVAEMSRMLAEKDEIHFHYPHTRRNGTTYPFEFIATPVQHDGKTQFIVVGSDITERLQREALIRSSEECLKLALEGSDHSMFVFDTRTDESYISDSIQQWIGATVSSIDDVNKLIESVEPEYREELNRQLKATSEQEREFNVELCTANERRCIHLRGRAYYNDAGRVERLIGSAADVTRQNVAERELHRALEDAQAATRAKSKFLATMSHEIRTPMNSVLGMTQLLLDMNLTNAQGETAGLILRSGEALLAIINDILDFSKIEAGKLDLEAIVFDLEHATREVMELMGGSARNKSLDLYVDYAGTLSPAYVGDEGRIRQILLNWSAMR